MESKPPHTETAVPIDVTEDFLQENRIWQYFMGDTPGISAWVDKRSGATRWTLRFVESIFRTFGALIFVNNVWSGAFFCLAVFLHDPFSAILGIIGIIVAYFTGMLLSINPALLRNGVATFNGFMVASFVGATSLSIAGIKWNPWLIFPAVFFSCISTFIKSAMHWILRSMHLPALNFPFSLATLCFLASQASQPAPYFPASINPITRYNETTEQQYDPASVFHGIFFSIANIYGCDNYASVTLAWIGVLIASPILFCMCLLGSCTGTGIAIILGVSNQQLLTGMWSFNSLLVCGSIGGFFCVWNPRTCAIAIFASATACVIAGELYHVLGYLDLPYQAVPLFLTDAIFLSALKAYQPKWLVRLDFDKIRYPEMHRRVHALSQKRGANAITPHIN